MQENIIQKLPEELINQIKAGEVVERPASVVKELVENSIDAKASSIYVELLDGGKQLIRITDNGVGISAQELPLALERHATSKLKNFSDLEKIASFGFRGEALPSIASVSEFAIKSRPISQNTGREVVVSQGKLISQKDIQLNQGTVIQAKDLFCNVPARLKFLKSTSTEYTHIHDFLLSMSFYYHNISFRLNHNGRDVFHYKQKDSSQKRFEEILAADSKQYAPIFFERGSFKITGFSLLPTFATSLSQYFVTFVNGRLVKDKVIRAGVLQAYQGLLLKGLVPSSIIFIEVDPAWIDVNVHPAKIEVRFADPLAVQELIAMGIQDCIKSSITKNLTSSTKNNSSVNSNNNFLKNISNIQANNNSPQNYYQNKSQEEVGKQRIHVSNLKTNTASFISSTAKTKPDNDNSANLILDQTTTTNRIARPEKISRTDVTKTENDIKLFQEPDQTTFSYAKYLGQYSNCYLILEKETQLWIIDQHAFHERILFEEYVTEYAKHSISKQSLLTPVILPASQQISSVAEEYKEKINELGFEIEILTDKNIAIHTYPSFLSTHKIIATVEELLNKLIANELVDNSKFYHLFYATLACHNAVRAGDPLNTELVQRLLDRSNNVDFFAHCPHGRPVIRKFEKKDVEAWFLRI